MSADKLLELERRLQEPAFLAGAAWGGEEAAKLAENERTPSGQYLTLNAGRIIAAAIREHFRDIRKHYDLTESE